MVVYTWWCWHIYKEDGVGVDVDQLGEETPPAPYTEKTESHWVHRTLALEVTGRWQGVSGQADAW